eukprot:4742144-Prymnesium_polylepis.1
MGWFFTAVGGLRALACDPNRVYSITAGKTRLDSTVLTARRQRTGTTVGEDTSPHTHSPSRPTRSQLRQGRG